MCRDSDAATPALPDAHSPSLLIDDRGVCLLQPLCHASLLLPHLAERAPLGFTAQFALGDVPALLSVDAEDLVLSHLLAETPEQIVK